jgi:hypothetical protein
MESFTPTTAFSKNKYLRRIIKIGVKKELINIKIYPEWQKVRILATLAVQRLKDMGPKIPTKKVLLLSNFEICT